MHPRVADRSMDGGLSSFVALQRPAGNWCSAILAEAALAGFRAASRGLRRNGAHSCWVGFMAVTGPRR